MSVEIKECANPNVVIGYQLMEQFKYEVWRAA